MEVNIKLGWTLIMRLQEYIDKIAIVKHLRQQFISLIKENVKQPKDLMDAKQILKAMGGKRQNEYVESILNMVTAYTSRYNDIGYGLKTFPIYPNGLDPIKLVKKGLKHLIMEPDAKSFDRLIQGTTREITRKNRNLKELRKKNPTCFNIPHEVCTSILNSFSVHYRHYAG
jgi:hypothetical protein